MKSIAHVRQPQHSWFSSIDEVFETRPPLCILRQENLQADMAALRRVLSSGEKWILESDGVKAHKNDYSNALPLSQRAIDNLRVWYAADIQFWRHANAWIEENQAPLLV
jgi:hypothetical protein